MENITKKRVAILGAGPSGLFMFKQLVESERTDLEIHLFEKKQQLGAGMPYSKDGANNEHITNVSANEIPEIVTPMSEWIHTISQNTLHEFDIDPDQFNEYKVLPRLLFGQYLSAQFELLKDKAKAFGFVTHFHRATVNDIKDDPQNNQVIVFSDELENMFFDRVIICTGHNWPHEKEQKIAGYYDSPYPPSKIELHLNHPVAIRGSSLTAIDAIRTLARKNGAYFYENDKLQYKLSPQSDKFKMIMHSRNGLLPAVRFHLDDTHLTNDEVLTDAEIKEHRDNNDGFLSLDFVFERNFKNLFKKKDPAFYEKIKDLDMETFVEQTMDFREHRDAFELLKAEYAEAEQSIKREKSVYWKEALGILSFAMNYPAKHFSAEDMLRLKKSLAPLISVVIAYVPQGSCREMLALHQAGVLEIISVGNDSDVEPQSEGAIYFYTDSDGKKHSVHYKTFIDCIGQPHLPYEKFPFKSLLLDATISPALLPFRSSEHGSENFEKDPENTIRDRNGDYYLKVPGVYINDNFQVIDSYGALNERIYIMAVPYIGGFNPDYSGLDFSEEASGRIVQRLLIHENAEKDSTEIIQ